MSYKAPYIDASGLHMPTYGDILSNLVEQAQSVFGADIYLGNDSADYQLLSIFALSIYESMEAVQLAYNSRSPITAIGAALDGLIKLNGMTRRSASYSTCTVTLTGESATTILNGVVQDVYGNKWSLPANVTIGGSGTTDVTATCQTIGAITVLAGEISSIVTPTAGWTSVTNANAAYAGTPVETDAALRSRQSISTELPSITMLSGTIAAIAGIVGVTRYKVYENPTNVVDNPVGPPHSITAVVEGGVTSDIAQVIYDNRGLGVYTAGDLVTNVTDLESMVVTPIRFYRPVPVTVYIEADIRPMTGYTTSMLAAARLAVVNYVNGLQIGETLTISALYGVLLSAMPSLTSPAFSVTALQAGITELALSSSDITFSFKEVAACVLADVVLNEVA
jgi:uncharacterized phage protein gp47/JayE